MGPLSLLLALSLSAADRGITRGSAASEVLGAAGPPVLETAEVDGGWVVLRLSTPTQAAVREEGSGLVVTFEGAVLGRGMKSLWSADGVVRELFPTESVEDGRPRVSVTLRLDAARSYLATWSGRELVVELLEEAPSGRWRAQLGSFLTQEEAAKLESELDPGLGNVEIRRAEVGGETRYRVLLGPFPSRAAAAAALRRWGREGFLRFD